MPSISKIRLTNVVYEEGNKRYNDELFLFDGHNGGILLENGGGKTVLIQTALQAVLPHVDLADRKIKNTLLLENAPAHIAIEWIDHEYPRRYVVTVVTLFLTKHGLDSLRYVYEYDAGDPNGIEGIPFVRDGKEGKRPAERGEMQDYYSGMKEKSSFFAHTFDTIKEYKAFIEKQYHIISSEWESIVKINSTEGGVESFFDDCKSTNQLFDRLLIPTVEDSIVGHDKAMFADMFEKQHQSFKNYKKLKETIDENKRIQEKLEYYVMTFEKLHHKQQAYRKAKQQAKGVWNLTLSQKQQMTDELAESSRLMKEWEKNHEKHKTKTASYEIAVEKAKLVEKEIAYNNKYANQLGKEEERNNHQKKFYSLKFAKHKLELKEEQDKLTLAKEKLADLEKDEELVDLQEALEKAKQSLLGSYLEEIEKIEKEKQGLTYQLNPILEQMEQLTSSKTELAENIVEVKRQLSAIQAMIKARTDDMEKLKQQLLANPQQEQVSSELKKWQERSNHLDQEIVRLNQKVKQLKEQIQDAEEQKEKLLDEQSEIEAKKNDVSFQLNELHDAQGNVITRLAILHPRWASIENIYSTQQTIETRMLEQMEKLKKERNNLLFRERLAYRFVDDYGNQDLFFGDPFLEEQLASWKNQLDYVVTGVEYLQNLDDVERNKKMNFPLWPLTLVTTNKSKQQLLDKVNHISDRLQFPITVLTTEEALRVDEIQSQDWVAPQHWKRNLETEHFNKWKQQIEADAQEITENREQKEKELTAWEDGWKAFKQFLEKYPYESYSSLSSERSKSRNRLEEVAIQINEEKAKMKEAYLNAESSRSKVENHTNEMQGLQAKIERGLSYLSYKKEVDVENEKKESVFVRLQQLEKEQSKQETKLQDFAYEKDELQQRIADLNIELKIVKREDDYVKVESLEPIYSGESKQSLKSKIHDLNRKMDKITVTQGEWIAKQEAATQAMNKLNSQIDEVRKQQSDLDEDQTFPSDGHQWMESLWRKVQGLTNELKAINKEVENVLSEKEQQKGKYKTKIEQFKKDFPYQGLIAFEQSLDDVADALRKEQEKLAESKVFIDQQHDRMTKQLDSIVEAERELERYIESHHFNAPDLQEILLTDEQKLDFNYQRKKYVRAVMEEMKKAKQEVVQEANQVEQAKVHVRDFCRKEISDVKLQQMAINGVEHKHTYQDVLAFKNNMFTSIDRISKYAHEHIRKSDEDLQLFINQIHTHLTNIVDELKQIPNKTKVKVLDDWKQIFTFSIPEWDEDVGKTRIRDHIEWILQQLESERFINDQGVQDEGKVRKDVEMWLQTKSLLQIVMNNEVMKVNCRKVTNDNKVTSKSFSWEQSNVWSGGEKWSKNMTLFLGILNYVAEKKQHLQSDMKRHRAVILDNPFGKASSDHVLSPVFFVAEQLGFQIIALTAHAEGKFLRDYFPIIYSCRLRSSQDSSKKVMTKEKWLHHAYFQDHEPQRLERLGEVKQMELF
jgi:chromosome segregation ATPase